MASTNSTGARDALKAAAAHYGAGRLEEAELACRDLLSEDPDLAEAWHLLGLIAQRAGNHGAAVEMIEEAIRTGIAGAEAHNNLGISLRHLGRLEEAEQRFRHATGVTPRFAEAHNNLGNALRELGRVEDAERSFRQARTLRPDFAEAHGNLGIALRDLGRLDEAEQSLRRAVALNPKYAEAHNDLGATLFNLGRLADAELCYRKAIELDPALVVAQRNLLFLLGYAPGREPAKVFQEHRAFASRNYPAAQEAGFENLPKPERRLRVGYVSGDLRHHPVGYFLDPVLEAHSPDAVEAFCYQTSPHADEMTSRLKSRATRWLDASALDDDALADRVRADGIDILVDLSGHTTHNRLGAFARRAAPVQVSWLGYLNTTGVEAMDYRLTDPRASPEGMFDALHSEKLVRLPDSQWCFRAPEPCPEITPPPSAASGEITFAALANPAKMGPEVIALWGRLLERVPGSRLLIVTNGLKSPSAEYAASFPRHGVPAKRVKVLGAKPFAEYLALHGGADIVLDTFPYTGGTTSCQALWMGVPVVTLVGNTPPSRGGASILHAVGLQELVAQTPEQYLQIAAALAGDAARLAGLRSGMRERMRRSPLMDAARFTRNLETAYRGMWRTWCGGRSVVGQRVANLLRKISGG